MLNQQVLLIAAAKAQQENKKVYIYRFKSFYFTITEEQRALLENTNKCIAIVHPNGDIDDCENTESSTHDSNNS